MKIKIKLIGLALLLAACGTYTETYESEEPKQDGGYGNPGGGITAGSYTFANVRSDCFTCHNSSAPAIPLSEAAFRSSPKVRARVADGTMPPNPRGFDSKAFLKYVDGN